MRVVDRNGRGTVGRRKSAKWPRARQSRVEGREGDRRNGPFFSCGFARFEVDLRRADSGSKTRCAKASSLIREAVSGIRTAAETDLLGLRRDRGIASVRAAGSAVADAVFAASGAVESRSRDERPRWALRALAALRRLVGMIQVDGKERREEYAGRVVVV